MKTYLDFPFMYFYDFHIKLWTIYEVDNNLFQLSNADYYHDKTQLLDAYPMLKFTHYEER